MSLSRIGNVDCIIDGNGLYVSASNYKYRAANELFTVAFNLLNGSDAKQLGIQLISANPGVSGSGMGFWDSATPSGENAWACFQFKSASVPFFVLMQYSGQTTFGTGLGVATGSLSVGTNGVGFSFCQKNDGTVPWNGTIFQHDDTRGNPIWAVNGRIAYPRANVTGGSNVSGSDGFITLSTADALTSDGQANYTIYGNGSQLPNNTHAYQSRAHFIVTREQFIAVVDLQGNATSNFIYFGKYTSFIPASQNPIPYACLAVNLYNSGCVDGNVLGNFSGPKISYGQRSLTYQLASPFMSAFINGGIVNPRTLNTVGLVFDTPTFILQKSPDPIYVQLFNQLSSSYTMFNIPLSFIDGNNSQTLSTVNQDPTPQLPYMVGEIDVMKFICEIPSNALLNGGQYAVIGPSQFAAIKLAIPWSGTTQISPGTSRSRSGYYFKV